MKKLILAFTLILSGTSVVYAQHAGAPDEQQACSRDASRFCRKLLGDDGAVQACLQQNRNRLTAACQKVFRSHGM
jgi:hypothetical protein